MIEDATSERLRCLPFIDPYGETIFNRGQIEILLDELRWLRARCTSAADLHLVDELLRLSRAALDDVHVYLRFSGD